MKSNPEPIAATGRRWGRTFLSIALLAWPSFLLAAETIVVKAGRPAVVRARAAALLLSGREGGPLPVQVMAVPVPSPAAGSAGSDTGAGPVAVVVEVPGRPLLREGSGDPLDVEIYVYALDGEGAVTASATQHLQVDAPEHRAVLAATGLKALVVLSLGPGEHRLRILVRGSSEVYGLRSHSVRISPTAPLPSPLLVAEPLGPWLVVLDPSAPGAGSSTGYPLEIGGEAVLPFVQPAVWVGEPFEALLLTRPAAPPALTASFRSREGAGDTLRPVEVRGRRELAHGWQALEVAVSPGELAVGEYDLEISSGVEGEGSPPLTVRVQGARKPPRRRAEIPPEVSPDAPPESLVVEGIAQARRFLEAGDLDSAREIVDTLLAGEGEIRRPLEEALRGAPPEAALPWALTFVDLARETITRQEHEAGRRAAFLAQELIPPLADSEPLREDGAWLLAGLGAAWLKSGAVSEGAVLLERSLALAMLPPVAELLAAVEEKRGRYPQALEALERLLSEDPEHRLGRLRKAVNLARTGRQGRARKILRALGGEPVEEGEEWIVLLAFQELARLESQAGRPHEALELLEGAARRWPSNPRLRIQRASLLTSTGESLAAGSLLASRPPGPAAGPSERYLYNRWPEDRWPEGRRRLARRILEGRIR